MAESFVFWRNLGFKLNKLTASKTSNAVSVKMQCFLAELDVHNDIIYHNIYNLYTGSTLHSVKVESECNNPGGDSY